MDKERKVWAKRWQKKKRLTGGGQSDAYLVTDLSNTSSAPAFLKTPRRIGKRSLARLEEEANTLKLLADSRLVPNLLDFSMDKSEAYIVMEHIDGESLSDLIEGNLFSLEDACHFTLGLLNTIGECHAKGVVHRDLKPGNIMVRSGTRLPIIVDFGIGFRDDEDRDDLTKTDEDFGNKFAQGPETISESGNQRTPVQDLSSACSILLYVLTGQKTGQYLDHEEQLPHQRQAAQKVLSTIEHSKRSQLLAIFDKAFQHSLKKRFQTVDELRAAIQRVLAPTNQLEKGVAEHHDAIRAAFSRAAFTESEETDKALMTVIDIIKQAYEVTRRELNSGLEFEVYVGPIEDYGTKRVLTTRMFHPTNDQRDFPCTYTATKIGSEIIVTTDIPDQPNFKRKNLEHIKLGLNEDIFITAKRFLAENLSRRLLMPNLQPIHRNIYEHLRQRRANLIHTEILSISDHRDETLIKGFEELSWLVKRYGIDLRYSLGSTTVVTEAGAEKVDLPSVLLIGAIDSENQLHSWINGELEVLRVATHIFPGGYVSQQRIFSSDAASFLLDLMKDKNLPPMQN